MTDAAKAAAVISKYRKKHGLGPVTTDPRLMTIAEARAQTMAARGRLEHGDIHQRIMTSGFNPIIAAENIAAGQQTFEQAFAGWQESAPHCANMLLPEATHIGIAVAPSSKGLYKAYWSLVIAGTADQGHQPVPDYKFGLPIGLPPKAPLRIPFTRGKPSPWIILALFGAIVVAASFADPHQIRHNEDWVRSLHRAGDALQEIVNTVMESLR